jgi:hypothetical protein
MMNSLARISTLAAIASLIAVTLPRMSGRG